MVLRGIISFLGLSRQAPQPASCQLPGCSKLCFVEADGKIHDFCSRAHAEQGLRQARRRSAAAAEFDGRKEYVFPDLVLFWQPPSVFSQWTPSTFSVDHVRGWLHLRYTLEVKKLDAERP